jgi:hypothetical protein
MNNDYQHNMNNNHHNISNNGFDNDYHRRTPPAPRQIDDDINDEQLEPSSHRSQQHTSSSIRV